MYKLILLLSILYVSSLCQNVSTPSPLVEIRTEKNNSFCFDCVFGNICFSNVTSLTGQILTYMAEHQLDQIFVGGAFAITSLTFVWYSAYAAWAIFYFWLFLVIFDYKTNRSFDFYGIFSIAVGIALSMFFLNRIKPFRKTLIIRISAKTKKRIAMKELTKTMIVGNDISISGFPDEITWLSILLLLLTFSIYILTAVLQVDVFDSRLWFLLEAGLILVLWTGFARIFQNRTTWLARYIITDGIILTLISLIMGVEKILIPCDLQTVGSIIALLIILIILGIVGSLIFEAWDMLDDDGFGSFIIRRVKKQKENESFQELADESQSTDEEDR